MTAVPDSHRDLLDADLVPDGHDTFAVKVGTK